MSASAQQFKLNEDGTIDAASLPLHEEGGEGSRKVEERLGVKLRYHFVDPAHERFDTVILEWEDGLRVLLDQRGSNAFLPSVKEFGVVTTFEMIHALVDDLPGVHRIG